MIKKAFATKLFGLGQQHVHGCHDGRVKPVQGCTLRENLARDALVFNSASGTGDGDMSRRWGARKGILAILAMTVTRTLHPGGVLRKPSSMLSLSAKSFSKAKPRMVLGVESKKNASLARQIRAGGPARTCRTMIATACALLGALLTWPEATWALSAQVITPQFQTLSVPSWKFQNVGGEVVTVSAVPYYDGKMALATETRTIGLGDAWARVGAGFGVTFDVPESGFYAVVADASIHAALYHNSLYTVGCAAALSYAFAELRVRDADSSEVDKKTFLLTNPLAAGGSGGCLADGLINELISLATDIPFISSVITVLTNPNAKIEVHRANQTLSSRLVYLHRGRVSADIFFWGESGTIATAAGGIAAGTVYGPGHFGTPAMPINMGGVAKLNSVALVPMAVEPHPSLTVRTAPPDRLPLGSSFFVEICGENLGRTADNGSVTFSFPDLFDKSNVVLEHISGASIPFVIRDPGESIWSRYCQQITASHVLAEADAGDWGPGHEVCLRVRVTPTETGRFRIRYRNTLSLACDNHRTDPSGLSCRDQQGFPCEEVAVNVFACGNGVVESGEECDGGDCCTADCRLKPSTTVCRPAAGPCDVPESCDGVSSNCPADHFEPPSKVCREAQGDCDLTEYCTGSSAQCPGDAKRRGICRSAAGPCDIPESCDGVSNNCPTDHLEPPSKVCREAQGDCDLTEYCTGSSAQCPGDAKRRGICRPAAGPCDIPESCDGVSNNCPTDHLEPPDKVCRVARGECDRPEYCSGSSPVCPGDICQADGTTCSDGICEACACRPLRCGNGIVDPGEECDGGACCSPSCEFQPSSKVCRLAQGRCDKTEYCTGSSSSCPVDAFEPPSKVCRPAEGECDRPEYCTGNSTSCPGDECQAPGSPCTGGVCDGCICSPLSCGDGRIVPPEECEKPGDCPDGYSCIECTCVNAPMIEVGNGNCTPGGLVSLPLTLTKPTTVGVAALRSELRFDTTLLEYQGAEGGPACRAINGVAECGSLADGGGVRCQCFTVDPAYAGISIEDGEVMRVRFRCTEEVTGNEPVAVSVANECSASTTDVPPAAVDPVSCGDGSVTISQCCMAGDIDLDCRTDIVELQDCILCSFGKLEADQCQETAVCDGQCDIVELQSCIVASFGKIPPGEFPMCEASVTRVERFSVGQAATVNNPAGSLKALCPAEPLACGGAQLCAKGSTSEIEVPIILSAPSGVGVASTRDDLTFDPAVLSFTGVTTGPSCSGIKGNASCEVIDNGVLRCQCFSVDSGSVRLAMNNGELMRVRFGVIGCPASAAIELVNDASAASVDIPPNPVPVEGNSCGLFFAPGATFEEDCEDCADNDCDALVDRDDPDCPVPADGGGGGLSDPKGRGKAVTKCGRALTKAGTKLTGQRMRHLHKCLKAVFACIQRKPGDAGCLVKAEHTCDKELAALVREEAKFGRAIRKACGVKRSVATPQVSVGDLLSVAGIGYEAEENSCAGYGVTSLHSLADVVQCVMSHHECAVDQMVAMEVPRAYELLALVGRDPALDLRCLPARADGGGAGLGDPRGRGKAVMQCEKAIKRAAATLVAKKSSALQTCASGIYKCVQIEQPEKRPGSYGKCMAKAAKACGRQMAAISRAGVIEAKFEAAVKRACDGLAVSDLMSPEGMGFSAISARCGDLGVGSLDSIGELAECLKRYHGCKAGGIVEKEFPRIKELFRLAGVALQ